jgi:hypothetical protein
MEDQQVEFLSLLNGKEPQWAEATGNSNNGEGSNKEDGEGNNKEDGADNNKEVGADSSKVAGVDNKEDGVINHLSKVVGADNNKAVGEVKVDTIMEVGDLMILLKLYLKLLSLQL